MLHNNLKKFYSNVAVVLRLKTMQDKFGGTQNEWEKTEYDLRCRLYGYKGNYTIQVQGQSYQPSMQMVCDEDSDIKVGDKVICDNNNYLALQVIPRQTVGTMHHISVLLTRLDE